MSIAVCFLSSCLFFLFFFFFSSRRRHTRLVSDWSSDVCSSDLTTSPTKCIRRRRPCPREDMRILFVGDIVGRPGRDVVERRLRALRSELDIDVCVVNGENAADGLGITPRLAEQLLGAGADAVTLGNHTWRRTEIAAYLGSSGRVIRPANFPSGAPGSGMAIVPSADGTAVAVINVLGSLYLEPARSMWELIDELVDEAHEQTPVVVVDVHAEATSEK